MDTPANKGPFFVGNVVTDVTDKEENSFCDQY